MRSRGCRASHSTGIAASRNLSKRGCGAARSSARGSAGYSDLSAAAGMFWAFPCTSMPILPERPCHEPQPNTDHRQALRHPDKLVDELAKGKAMEKNSEKADA